MTGTDILIFQGLVELLELTSIFKTRIRIWNRTRIQKFEGSDPDPEKVIRICNTGWRTGLEQVTMAYQLQKVCVSYATTKTENMSK